MKILKKITDFSSLVRYIKMLYIAFTDKRTPRYLQVIMGVLAAGYLLAPFDIVPDFVPLLGIIDDATLISLLGAILSRWIPQEILDEARALLQKKSQK